MRQAAFERCTVHVPSETEGVLLLAARYARGERGGSVVAPPHPLYGGTFDNPVVQKIARGLQRVGLGVLTFNWRGVEGSTGQATGALEAAVSDYTASLDAVAARTQGPLVAAGYSFGAATALLCARDNPCVSALVLVAPPVGMLRAEDLRAYAGKLLVLAGEHDELAQVAELTSLLTAHPDSTLEVISDADHFFHFGGVSEVERIVATRVAEWHPAPPEDGDANPDIQT